MVLHAAAVPGAQWSRASGLVIVIIAVLVGIARLLPLRFRPGGRPALVASAILTVTRGNGVPLALALILVLLPLWIVLFIVSNIMFIIGFGQTAPLAIVCCSSSSVFQSATDPAGDRAGRRLPAAGRHPPDAVTVLAKICGLKTPKRSPPVTGGASLAWLHFAVAVAAPCRSRDGGNARVRVPFAVRKVGLPSTTVTRASRRYSATAISTCRSCTATTAGTRGGDPRTLRQAGHQGAPGERGRRSRPRYSL